MQTQTRQRTKRGDYPALAIRIYEHARANKSSRARWDYVYECWSHAEIEEYLQEQKCDTWTKALREFTACVSAWSQMDRR